MGHSGVTRAASLINENDLHNHFQDLISRPGRALLLGAGLWAPLPVAAADPGAEPVEDGVFEVVVEDSAPTARDGLESADRVELDQAQTRSADLGEVLAAQPGVVVQRSGGLGSPPRLNLDGFSGEQVRIFVDGVPLEYTGLGASLADIPLDLIAAVEVHHGVVPIRLGADALGGAVALETQAPAPGLHGGASVQAGAWQTLRAAGRTTWLHAPTGLYVEAAAFGDRAANDWPVDVELADLQGQIRPARVARFNGDYAASGGRVALGVVDRPWADRAELRLVGSTLARGIPHNLVMTVPYGEVRAGRSAGGATARWAGSFGPFSAQAIAAWSRRETRFSDEARVVYDWHGAVLRDRPQPGELGAASRLRTTQDAAFGQLVAGLALGAHHTLQAAATVHQADRVGDDHFLGETPGTRDPHATPQRQQRLVVGLSWRSHLWEDRLSVEVFGKGYGYRAALAGTLHHLYAERERALRAGGAGASARLQGPGPSYLKLAAEQALRLPTPDEVFGDGVLIQPNIALAPEHSRNANLELGADGLERGSERLALSVRGLLREADDLVVLMSNNISQQWQNVYRATGRGLQGSLAWSHAERVGLGGQAGWMALRNASEAGSFSRYAGDRIPNRPYLDSAARLWAQSGPLAGRLHLGGDLSHRFIQAFYRSWESAGDPETKQQVPAQQLWGAGLWARWEGAPVQTTLALGASNLLDAPAYDLFGVQRPGRSLSAKLSLRW